MQIKGIFLPDFPSILRCQNKEKSKSNLFINLIPKSEKFAIMRKFLKRLKLKQLTG